MDTVHIDRQATGAWHVMDALSVWSKEFASALGRFVQVTGWIPELRWTGILGRWERKETLPDPSLETRRFPLQRGYRRSAFLLSRTGDQLLRRMRRGSVLICTSPYYAPVAERWSGHVVYYVTDLLIKYGGFRESQVRALDRRMCRAAVLVCPNSTRIARYLVEGAQCPPDKIVILPNATRQENVQAELARAPAILPDDISHLGRPVAGVIGNLAENMDWKLLREAVDQTPWLSWVFVGPANSALACAEQRRARADLMCKAARVRFTGPKPYSVLRDYARAFDVAVLPYRRKEPTYSGSSTRFYEHLAALRPMVATRGFAELLEKEPLVKLVDTAAEMAFELQQLDAAGYSDGCESLRWYASRSETWEARAQAMADALAVRTGGAARPCMQAGTPVR
jgi:glycosyltransferase involved in cell wall biosynthesis